MFPKDVGEFAYADLKAARQFPWFSQLREQLLPSRFRQFEQFLTSAGVDPNAQVDELAWASTAMVKGSTEQVIGVALEHRSSVINARIVSDDRRVPMLDIHGYLVYAFGSGTGAGDILFTFIDSNTAAFGQRAALEKMIDVRTGVAERPSDQ